MTDDNEFVFISYVREDNPQVERLASELRREGVKVWLDREDIQPGAFWADSLKRAIGNGAYFLACFSRAYHDRHKSTYMNEELKIACQSQPETSERSCRIIPVLLSQCELPTFPLGNGKTIRDVQWIDLSQDWEREVWKLLQVIRPSSLTDPKSDQILRHLCDSHIRGLIGRAESMGAIRIRQIEEAWKSLLLPTRWNPTVSVVLRLLKLAVSRGVPLTERWVEKSESGIHILVTCSPTASPETVLKSLCPESSATSNVYGEFIRKQRQYMRRHPDWPRRDMAHWIFSLDQDTITADLMYWLNLDFSIGIIAHLTKTGRYSLGNSLHLEGAVPGSLQTNTEFEALQNTVMREEAGLL